MENLTLEEAPPQGAPGGALLGPGIAPPQNQQLPPQMFTTAAQLLDMTDSKDFFVLTFLALEGGSCALNRPSSTTASTSPLFAFTLNRAPHF
jgi:hypothetical protein